MDVWYQEIQKNCKKLPRFILVSFELKTDQKPVPFEEVKILFKLL